MTGLLKPLKEKEWNPLAFAAALLVAWGIWRLSGTVVEGSLGWLFDKLNLSNEDRSFTLGLGSIVQTVLVVGLSWFAMLFLLKGGNPVSDIKEAVSSPAKEGEAKAEEKKEEAAKEEDKKDEKSES